MTDDMMNLRMLVEKAPDGEALGCERDLLLLILVEPAACA